MNGNDYNLLKTLWQWKCLTPAALTEIYYPKNAPSYCYRRLVRLRDAKLIETCPIKDDKTGRSFVWSLTKKGFETIQDGISDLKEVGFKSESIDHDLLVAAVHIGDWLSGAPNDCEVFTEQQLRRMHEEHYPSWIPKGDGHRPDGYWRTLFEGKKGTIALEVERNRKSLDDYIEAAQFYALRENLFRVMWIVRLPGAAKLVAEAAQKVGGAAEGLHNFILESDFRKSGWGAYIFMGRDTGKPLSHFLPSSRSKSEQYVAPTLLLNTMKSPHMSKPYLEIKKILKCNRLGSSLVSEPSSLPLNLQTKGPTNEQ